MYIFLYKNTTVTDKIVTHFVLKFTHVFSQYIKYKDGHVFIQRLQTFK